MSERACDHCGELPGTVELCDVLAYCVPCFDEAGDGFAVGYGWMTQHEADARAVERVRMREALAAEEAT